MAIIHLTSTRLKDANKLGKLEPDADGYYTLVVGALNAFNSVKQYYTLQGASELFKSSSIFMRRLKNGCVKAEVGHPKQLPGMSDDAYLTRILSIEETNTCAHISEIWLDNEWGKTHPEFGNPEMVAILAKVKPSGPKGPALLEALQNPLENVCFSIRSLTRDYWDRGTKKRELAVIVTFDWVTEPGIETANKWSAPGLESTEDRVYTTSNFKRVLDKLCNDRFATESSRSIAVEAMDALSHFDAPVKTTQAFAAW